MAGNGGKVAGIISIVLSAIAAVIALLNYPSHHHPRRVLVALIACGVLLVLGIVLIAVSSRTSSKTSAR